LFLKFRKEYFLHKIITGDEKWILYDNPKRRKSWVDPGQPSTSTPKPSIHYQEGFALVGLEWYVVLEITTG